MEIPSCLVCARSYGWAGVGYDAGASRYCLRTRFAEMKDPVKDKLIRFELFDRFGAANFYPTIGSAVDAYLDEHAVDWKS